MLTLRCPFHPRVAAVVRIRPRSFCQMCRWQVTPKHTYTLDPTKSEWYDYAAVQALCGNLSGNQLTRNLSGNIQPQSSQLTEPLCTDPDLNSAISVRELISTSNNNNNKSAGGEWMVEHSPQILTSEERATTTTTTTTKKYEVIYNWILTSSGVKQWQGKEKERDGDLWILETLVITFHFILEED